MDVRWDAVARGDPFGINRKNDRDGAAPAQAGPLDVEVWLFGRLMAAGWQNPLALNLPAGNTLRDLFRALAAHLDAESLARLVSPEGELLRTCRVFVDGLQADGLATPVRSAGVAARIEIIVLTAAEGG
ncbi:MAG: hypothetical protein A3I01_14410 [Betaproteobacteria bacterium RIFCSPLOWO2_02_FULL_65_24]|nr:MAG: hypothetical protein A3I01_14410 [Betaproteobacteria bacterium RIFCSPLOWO2_02_FULL_65_24]